MIRNGHFSNLSVTLQNVSKKYEDMDSMYETSWKPLYIILNVLCDSSKEGMVNIVIYWPKVPNLAAFRFNQHG